MFSDKSYLNHDDKVINIIYPTLLANIIEKKGFSKDELFESAGLDIDDLQGSKVRLSLREFIDLVDSALQMTGDPELGLEFGSILNLASSGYLVNVLTSCATLGEALLKCLKYYPANGVSMEVEFEQQGDEMTVVCPSLGQLALPVRRFMFDTWLAAWVKHSSSLIQAEFSFSAIYFSFPEPSNLRRYEELFGCDIIFNAQCNRVCFPVRQLEEELPTANDIVLQISEGFCDEMLDEVKVLESLSGCVADVLNKWTGPSPSVESVAKVMKMTPRALARRLNDQGTSYQVLFNRVRQEKAMRYISHNGLSVEMTAEKLGFSDASNFRKAFKRWTGQTPSFYRRQVVATM